MKRSQDIRKQLLMIMERYGLRVQSAQGDTAKIRKSIAAGFFAHTARKNSKEGYRTLIDNHQVYIHPSSSLFNRAPEWVVYHELVFTTKEYMREVIAVDPKWLLEVSPLMFKGVDPMSYALSRKGEKIEPLYNKYEETNVWRLTQRRG